MCIYWRDKNQTIRVSKTLLKIIRAINPFHNTMKADKPSTLFFIFTVFSTWDHLHERPYFSAGNGTGYEQQGTSGSFSIFLNWITWTLPLTLQVYFLTMKELKNTSIGGKVKRKSLASGFKNPRPCSALPEDTRPFSLPSLRCSQALLAVRGGLEDVAEQCSPLSLQPPQRPIPSAPSFSAQPGLPPRFPSRISSCYTPLPPPTRPQRAPAPSFPGGGSVLKSPSLPPARGVGKSPLATAGPTNPEGFVVAGETRGPGGDSPFSGRCPLRYPPPAAFTQRRDNSASVWALLR